MFDLVRYVQRWLQPNKARHLEQWKSIIRDKKSLGIIRLELIPDNLRLAVDQIQTLHKIIPIHSQRKRWILKPMISTQYFLPPINAYQGVYL